MNRFTVMHDKTSFEDIERILVEHASDDTAWPEIELAGYTQLGEPVLRVKNVTHAARGSVNRNALVIRADAEDK